jgi:MT0933-like antitoxin protein
MLGRQGRLSDSRVALPDNEHPKGNHMGLADRLKDLTKKAEDTAAEHKDQIHQAVEKAEATADQRTGGKYHEQIQKAGAKADSFVDGLQET